MDFLTILSALFFLLGSISILIGVYGLITLKDVYSRIHAAGMVDTAGVAFYVLAMVLQSGWSLVTVKLLLIGIFLIFTSPISGHAVAQVAYQSGHHGVGRDLTKTAKASQKKGNAS